MPYREAEKEKMCNDFLRPYIREIHLVSGGEKYIKPACSEFYENSSIRCYSYVACAYK